MLVDSYYDEAGGKIRFSRQQASDFAKNVAGDFNPIHDPESKRFCVPGDLLFALGLKKYGLSGRMHFTFLGMVSEGVALNFPDSNAARVVIADDKGRAYLSIDRDGDVTTDEGAIDDLTRSYIEFSGRTFPHILVPLMAASGAMINPERPMVIYESMTIELARLDIAQPRLELSNSRLEVNGKRGNVRLEFSLAASGEPIGKGEKNMVLSGLRPFDREQVRRLADTYTVRKRAYLEKLATIHSKEPELHEG